MKDKDADPGHANFCPEAGCAWFCGEQGGGLKGRRHCREGAGEAGAGNRGGGGYGGELYLAGPEGGNGCRCRSRNEERR